MLWLELKEDYMKKKIKFVDFLEFVNFRDYTDSDEYNTKIIRIWSI